MRTWMLGALALALIVGGAACGGGGDKTIKTDGGQVRVSDDLPDSFPDDFPIYDGADLQGAVEGEQQGIEGVIATWTTKDDLNDVVQFYKDKLGKGDWSIQSQGSGGGTNYWVVENSKTNKTAYVSVTGEDEVSIVATVGDNPDQASGDDNSGGNSGSGDDSSNDDGTDGSSSDDSGDSGSGNSQLPDEVDVPDDFPKDEVPLVDDARVTSANSFSAGGTNAVMVSYYTKKSAEEIASFYKDKLEGKGYTQSVQTKDANGVYAAYAENDDGTGRVVVMTVTEGDVDGYRQVALQVSGT